MKNPVLNSTINTLALAGVLTVNALANILPINGLNTGQVSALYPTLFTPAGITFSIWSIIYVLLLGFIGFQWLQLKNERIQSIITSITPAFQVSCILNMAWIFAWHYLMVGTSVIIMLALLTSLITLFLTLQKHKSSGFAERTFLHLPFTIYLAWICVATIANLSIALYSIQWKGLGLTDAGWTVIMMTVAASLAGYITIRFLKPAFALVVIWALTGIYLRWNNSPENLITYAAIILIILLATITTFSVRQIMKR